MTSSSTLSVFSTDPPNLNADQVDSIARDYYGITGTQTALVSERDQNIKLDSANGAFVLKIANAAEDPAILALQNQAMMHVNRFSGRALAPAVIPGKDGNTQYEHSNGTVTHSIRMLGFIEGPLYSQIPADGDLLEALGVFVGRLSTALTGFGHPAAHRQDFLWNLDNAMACKPFIGDINKQADREIVCAVFDRYEQTVLPKLGALRAAVVHQDVNDNNIVIDTDDPGQIAGLIDFGDVCFARQVNELAVAMAYALQGQADLYGAGMKLVSAYTSEFPLNENELDVLYDLMRMRLAMSVCISSHRSRDYLDNEYLMVSQQPMLDLLRRLEHVTPGFMTAVLRKAAGLPATPNHDMVTSWLRDPGNQFSDLFDIDLQREPRRVIRLDNPGPELDVQNFDELLSDRDRADKTAFLIGLYGEDRNVYRAGQFASPATPERRTIHLGQDFFVAANTPLYTPLPGRVHSVVDNNFPLDYGPTVILEHTAGKTGCVFYTLYGHLSRSALELLTVGQPVRAGQLIGHIGEYAVNGGWAPHLHFQLITDVLGLHGNFNGVGEKSLWPVWREICPDPNLITRLAPESFDLPDDEGRLMERRRGLMSPSLSLSYRNKLHIVRGQGVYLYDRSGRQYLDCVNNICHVGHCQPQVVKAMARQAAVLNTNTRYLSKTRLDYAQRLTGLFPDPLNVVFFVNSGTEANELALRIARTATGHKETIVLDWAYHGNSAATVEISPYKFKRAGGFEKPGFVEIAEFPDPYRGRHKGMDNTAGLAYAESVAACVEAIRQRTGHGPAAFIAESISGVGGQVVYPDGYLQAAYKAVREQGGICISDEVQCGFGRVGSHFWAFEPQDVVPDIVVLGKPMGNGHPLAAVVTTAELAGAFANGMEYFNSFGGNPVSMAVGNAVLDVIEQQELVDHVKLTGNYLLNKFNQLKQIHQLIGDVRGQGLFLGLELVTDRETLEPAARQAGEIVNQLREKGVLLSTDGPCENVLKFKPPMVFSKADADFLCEHLEACLTGI